MARQTPPKSRPGKRNTKNKLKVGCYKNDQLWKLPFLKYANFWPKRNLNDKKISKEGKARKSLEPGENLACAFLAEIVSRQNSKNHGKKPLQKPPTQHTQKGCNCALSDGWVVKRGRSEIEAGTPTQHRRFTKWRGNCNSKNKKRKGPSSYPTV